MGNSNLKGYINDFFNDFKLYDDVVNGHQYTDVLKAVIDAFLDNETADNATDVFETFFMIYQITSEDKSEVGKIKNESFSNNNEPNTLLELVDLMRNYELNTGDLIDKQRDHFIHSVNVFVLGLAIYSQNETYRGYFKQYIIDSPYDKFYQINDEYSREEFLYRWGIASLFHDIGYPIEIIGKQLRKFINQSIKSISVSYDVETAIDFKDFDEFNSIRKMRPDFTDRYRNSYSKAKFLNLFKPTDLMAHKISHDFNSLDINELIKHLNNFVYVMGEQGFIDHGFFSSILVLNSYGNLIQKYHRKDHNPDFFFYPIVDSACAILLHNYFGNVLRKDPFNLPVLDPSESPLVYLLILCDELQEWNRQPYGSQDKKRHHVNELKIEISNKRLDVTYILKEGLMGLGFSRDKESFLYNVLAIRNVFSRGLSIETENNKNVDYNKKWEEEEVYEPYVSMSNIEKLARGIHANYKEKQGPDDDSIPDYDNLAPDVKLSNINAAKDLPRKLSIVGCEMAPIPKEDEENNYDVVHEFTSGEIRYLARLEHKRWCREKFNYGWQWGKKTDRDNKIHSSLVSWDKLSPEEQQKDIDSIEAIPDVLEKIGMRVVKSRLILLAHEKHNFYSESEKVVQFNELAEDIQFLNYKQTYYMAGVFREIGLAIVPIDSEGKPVKSLNEKQVEYLAKKDHKAWYGTKLDLGYRRGPRGVLTNPNIKPWDELDNATKNLNMNTYQNIPGLCEKVGLKIIKVD